VRSPDFKTQFCQNQKVIKKLGVLAHAYNPGQHRTRAILKRLTLSQKREKIKFCRKATIPKSRLKK
jgi:hypothetical protein